MITTLNDIPLGSDDAGTPSSQITEEDLIAIQAISGKSPMVKEDYDVNNNLRVDIDKVSVKLTLTPVTQAQAQADFNSVYQGA